jgi:hypothetical protein
LLAHVTIIVSPSHAGLTINGKTQRAGEVALSPGRYTFAATLDSHAPAQQQLSIPSGRRSEPILLTLQPLAWTPIPAAQPPGTEPSAPMNRRDADLTTTGAVSVANHRTPTLAIGDTIRIPLKFYGQVGAKFVMQTTAVTLDGDFKLQTQPSAGGGVSLYGGVRVHDNFGAELTAGYTTLTTSVAQDGALVLPQDVNEASYTLSSVSVGGRARLFIPAKNRFKGVAALGGGLSFDRVHWNTDKAGETLATAIGYKEPQGIGAYGQAEFGLCMDFSGLLIDIVLQAQLQSSKHLGAPLDARPLALIGNELRVGYGLW